MNWSEAQSEHVGERLVAGIDLGSNSFHMLVARLEQDERVHVLDRIREPVRLAAGLDAERRIKPAVAERALASLARMEQRLRGFPAQAVRAVGTNALRRAKNGAEFLEAAQAALGHRIEVISGHEEARLIYLGVSHNSADDSGRHLVIDIGGGSTELIIGERFEPLLLDSLYMGCVSFTERFFPGGHISPQAFRAAEIAASLELSSLREQYRSVGWQRVTASSGTALAIFEVLRANKWAEHITLEGLQRTRQALIEQGHVSKIALKGLEPDRALVFPGGVAILRAVFDTLELNSVGVSNGALREGLVYELLGRVTHEDVERRTIRTFAERYKVDTAQADRVTFTALKLLEAVVQPWSIEKHDAAAFMRAAGQLHEVGLTIAYAGYHKHGAYILEHSDMPGFSRDSQVFLAMLVRTHRRRFRRELLAQLPKTQRKLGLQLGALLRLAVCLHHSRSAVPLPEFKVKAEKTELHLQFPNAWLQEHPLTSADLEQEAQLLREVGLTLSFN